MTKQMILIGNAANVLKEMRANYIDLVVTSPPYDGMRAYNGYKFDWGVFKTVAKQLYRVLKPGGTLVWVVGDQTKNGTESGTSFKQALYFKERCGFNLHDTMIYERHGPPLTHRRYEQAFEYMFVMTKGIPKVFNGITVPKTHLEKRARVKGYGRWEDNTRDMGKSTMSPDKLAYNVWKISVGRMPNHEQWVHEHPAIFPERLALMHVHSWSNPGDIVLDPFCGSGTTGKAALNLGRSFIGIDISVEYAQMTARRIGAKRAYTWS